MPRFVVERTFPGALAVPGNRAGAEARRGVVDVNALLGVTWFHSYVTEDREKTFCVHEERDSAAIREAAERNGLPVDLITPVSVLDPYFYC